MNNERISNNHFGEKPDKDELEKILQTEMCLGVILRARYPDILDIVRELEDHPELDIIYVRKSIGKLWIRGEGNDY